MTNTQKAWTEGRQVIVHELEMVTHCMLPLLNTMCHCLGAAGSFCIKQPCTTGSHLQQGAAPPVSPILRTMTSRSREDQPPAASLASALTKYLHATSQNLMAIAGHD
jgi:hypothetical protein